METKRQPTLCDDLTCTGCSACYNACPVESISIQPSSEGFYRPVVCDSKCIRCLKCEKNCPIITPVPTYSLEKQQVFAAWNNDVEVRRNSSSGGAFSALAQTIISEHKGIVYGAAYDTDMTVQHVRVENINEITKLRLSKYVQSSIGNTFRLIKDDLSNGKPVLFCGTPCQAAGLRSFLCKPYDNLIICDFICHGVPSPLMLKKFREWLKPKTGEIMRINFRDKRKGWYDALRIVTNNNGKEYILRGKDDNYWEAFNSNNNLQDCCYYCQFLGRERRSDITIADFWGIGRSEPFGHKNEIEKGISAIIVNTEKGRSIVTESKKALTLFPRSINEVVKSNQAMIHSSIRPISRNTFYKDLNQLIYPEMIKKYLILDNKTELVKVMREYMPRFIIEFIRTRHQK